MSIKKAVCFRRYSVNSRKWALGSGHIHIEIKLEPTAMKQLGKRDAQDRASAVIFTGMGQMIGHGAEIRLCRGVS